MKSSKTAERSVGLRNLLREFRPELRTQRGRLGLGLAALFAEVGLRLLEPWPIQWVFDHVLTVRSGGVSAPSRWTDVPPLTLLALAALALVAVTGLRSLAAYASTIAFAVAGSRVLSGVRGRLFRHLHRLPLSFHTRARSGDLVVRVMGDVGLLQDVLVTALLPLIARALILVGMISVMFWMQWQLAALALALLPLFWLRTVTLGRELQTVARQQRRREGAMAATAAESFTGMKVIQALSVSEAFFGSFHQENDRTLHQDVKGKRLAARLERSVDVLIAASTALVLWQGARLVLRGELSPGELLVFIAYLKAAFRPIQDFAKFTSRLSKAGAAGARVLELLELPPAIADQPNARPLPDVASELRGEGVQFSHVPGQPVLQDVSFVIPAGHTAALLGPSGSGKSTLLSLLLRLHEPTAGRIVFAGHDLRDYSVESLRRQCGLVLQENVLFTGTLHDNIALGRPDATRSEVEAAARLAQADDFIQAFPEGYDTPVGERGATLSQGQRQRIAIARAALRNTRLLLFDEPTTGLDPANEQAVVDALRNLARGRTTLWVTHNPRHAVLADFVFTLHHGRLIAVPKPDLVAANSENTELSNPANEEAHAFAR
ncbi:MAG: ABC transporter ATP-binding protein [Verrucomicrobia bacterium]|nr:ABC transporter ATP-binding protein [Verrucomicrobiota bacterium]